MGWGLEANREQTALHKQAPKKMNNNVGSLICYTRTEVSKVWPGGGFVVHSTFYLGPAANSNKIKVLPLVIGYEK